MKTKGIRLSSPVTAALLAAGLALSDAASAASAVALEWNPGQYATISGNILTVDVPAEAVDGTFYGARASFDLAQFEGRTLSASVLARAETPIIVESNNKDAPLAFTYLSPLDLTNVIYQVHMYEPGDFTHQIPKKGQAFSPETAVSYPAPGRDRAALKKALAPVRAFEKKHGAKIYVGEFSASAWAPGADRYIADCIALFREYGWDWTYHAFREWEGWSVEHEPVSFGTTPDCFRPSANNPRKRALLAGLKGASPSAEHAP